MKIKTKPLLWSLGAATVITGAVAYWTFLHKQKSFDCWARLHTFSEVDGCQRSSFTDVFLSLHSGGEGYVLAEGEWACQDGKQHVASGIINFRYVKQGDYYSIHTQERSPKLETLFSVLKYRSIKLKITALNSSDYVLTLPNETLMICTKD